MGNAGRTHSHRFSGIGYDEDRRVLYVQYVDGEVFEYFKVPKNDYLDY